MSNQYYDRSTPYNYCPYQPRRNPRSEYPGRHSTRAFIHEEALGPNGQPARKRIGVACTRCRKRKIKCTGDVGDGSGCAACKAQGGDNAPCTFNRVGSGSLADYETYLTNNQPRGSQDVTYMGTTASTHTPSMYGSLTHRQSLPILQTRMAHSEGYDSYSASPIDGYPYAAYDVPRNDSVSSAFDNSFRSYSNAGVPTSLPITQPQTFEQSPGYTFGSISTPSFPAQTLPPQQQQQSVRAPSVTSEAFSLLNMGHLYTSLPTQTVQSRRLPIPQTTPSHEMTPYTGPELPEIRPLAEPRTRLNSTYSRIGAPWASDYAYVDSRNGSSSSLVPPHSMPHQPTQSTSMVQEPVVGYHYSTSETMPASTASPSISPTTGPPFSSAASYGSYYGLPPINTTYRANSDASRNSMSLPATTSYSYGADATTTASSSDHGGSSDPSTTALPNTSSAYASSSYANYPSIRHPQPQHATSTEALRRQASFEQQPRQHQRSGAPSQRISVSDLSGDYTGS